MSRRGFDLTGQKFGRLEALSREAGSASGMVWLVRCECGNDHKATASQLVRGHVKSCGCLYSDPQRATRFKYAISVFGVEMRLTEVAKLIGISEETVKRRIAIGLTPGDELFWKQSIAGGRVARDENGKAFLVSWKTLAAKDRDPDWVPRLRGRPRRFNVPFADQAEAPNKRSRHG